MEVVNVFRDNTHRRFDWSSLGDVAQGRRVLGEEMPVLVYRLMQFTLLDIISAEVGLAKANDFVRKAGYLAGTEFTKNTLSLDMDFDSFISQIQNVLKSMKIGILRLESVDNESGSITFTVSEDLDCSGLPATDEHVCVYHEGFFAGVFEIYSGEPYFVKEIDCWAAGSRICRFFATPGESDLCSHTPGQ